MVFPNLSLILASRLVGPEAMARERLIVSLSVSSMHMTAGARAVPVDLVETVEARDRWERRRVGIAWALLILNTLTYFPSTYSGLPLVVPVPSSIGKGITQAALPMALILLLTVNRRMAIRPSMFLFLVSLLVVEALLTSVEVAQLGNAYRTFRFAEFVVALWLLSPWWGRRDLLLVRCHLVSMYVVLGSVVLGILVAPSTALAQGRLEGAFWPNPPTEIAEFAAVTLGIVVILWLERLMSGRVALTVVISAGAILLLTHTRTALIALLSGLLVGALSLFLSNARVRNFFVAVSAVAFIGVLTVSSVVTTWWARGEASYELYSLTGRSRIWAGLLNIPRNQFQMLLGSGLSGQGYLGAPIDNSWLVAYNEQGLISVTICAAMLLSLFVTACFRARGVRRALALFLVTYCSVTSYTESGISAPSTILLYLALAASLLVPSVPDSRLPSGS